MQFKDQEEYKKIRNELMQEASKFHKNNDLENGLVKLEAVEKLDNEFKEFQSKEAKRLANEAILNEKFESLNSVNVHEISSVRDGKIGETTKFLSENSQENADNLYETAWAKKLMNRTLDKEERKIFELNNGQSTGNTSMVIPRSVVTKVWAEISDMYAMWRDVNKLHVKGNLSLPKELEDILIMKVIQLIFYKKRSINKCFLKKLKYTYIEKQISKQYF